MLDTFAAKLSADSRPQLPRWIQASIVATCSTTECMNGFSEYGSYVSWVAAKHPESYVVDKSGVTRLNQKVTQTLCSTVGKAVGYENCCPRDSWFVAARIAGYGFA